LSHVFISYARSTEGQARRIGEALRALGHAVWRDDELPAHRSYAEVIEERLRTAQAVVVVWSADAARSEWVQSEADRARADHKLVQLTVDGAPLPMPFDRIQCADLTGWAGEDGHAGWRKVIASIAELIGARDDRPVVSTLSAPATPPSPASAEPVLAVLAFDNLSGDPQMAYFSDGVSEEIQDTVVRGADLRVIGRTSSFQLRGADKSVRRVVEELGASHILDGSVRRAGDRVRITTQLIECAGGATLWSNRFDRDLTDIFAVQDEIAAAVCEALKTTFQPPAAAEPVPPDIYDLYLQARALYVEVGANWEQRRTRTLAMLEEVVERAPTFAKAWADLAQVSAGVLRFADRGRFPTVSRQSVRHAAQTAIRLDPGSGPAYLALSLLEPFGHYQARADLHARALASVRDMATLSNTAMLYFELGHAREGLALSQLTADLNPQIPLAWFMLIYGLAALGHCAKAKALCEQGMGSWPGNPSIMGTSLYVAALSQDWAWYDRLIAEIVRLGLKDEELDETIAETSADRDFTPAHAEAVLAEAAAGVARDGMLTMPMTLRLSWMGKLDEVFELIEQASYEFMLDPDGPPPGDIRGLIFAERNRPMIEDPRFVRLCAKMGLTRYWVDSGRWPDCADQVPYDFKAEAARLAQAAGG
jgi:TolB-like protein